MFHIFFIQSSFEEHLSCFLVLLITNNADMNIDEQMSLWYDCASFGYMPRWPKSLSTRVMAPKMLFHSGTPWQSHLSHWHPSSFPQAPPTPSPSTLSLPHITPVSQSSSLYPPFFFSSMIKVKIQPLPLTYLSSSPSSYCPSFFSATTSST